MSEEIKKESIIKKLFYSFFMCLSMFTIIPPIVRKWDDEAKDYMIIMLPFVGGIIGGLWYGLSLLLNLCHLPLLFNSLILTVFPFLTTGFIHFDGFLDVVDATKSFRSKEEKIQILKDPHVGSFAVCYGIITILAMFVGIYLLNINHIILVFIPVVSRLCAGLFLCFFKKISVSEYNKEESKGFKVFKIIYFTLLIIGLMVLCYFIVKLYAISLLVLVLMSLIIHLIVSHNLGGINGDVSGCAITISELMAILSIIILGVIL